MRTGQYKYVGESGTQAFDGWAGFRIDHTYTFTVTGLENGGVDITLVLDGRERDLTIPKAQFEKWFKKA